MTDKQLHLRVDADYNQAEGSPSRPDEDTDYSVFPDPIHAVSVMKRRSPHELTAETGIVAAVSIRGEGKDDGDAQDASRTSDETRQAPVAEKETARKMEHPLTVLIVEDTLELAEVIMATLERMDLNVVHAAHGTRALQKLDDLNPDVVLLDISLPDMTGWNIMDTLKARFEENPNNMPVIIIITAYDDPANRLVGKLQGVHSYLIKPFTADEIEHAVTQAISSMTG